MNYAANITFCNKTSLVYLFTLEYTMCEINQLPEKCLKCYIYNEHISANMVSISVHTCSIQFDILWV